MPLHNGRALDNLIFPQRVKDLINEIELWRNNRDWYADKGIPWKRGWLLYGPPGTGKTALARAFAEDLNMPIYVFNLAEMGNHELIKAWTEMQVNVPCIALIEDIDNVFHGRENVVRRGSMMSMMLGRDEKKGGNGKNDDGMRDMFAPLTFDCLLNCLDGVERTDGIFTIITTNDLTKIDPALGQPRKLPDGTTEFISTRPGRIDKAVELTYMEPADKKLMAKRILGRVPGRVPRDARVHRPVPGPAGDAGPVPGAVRPDRAASASGTRRTAEASGRGGRDGPGAARGRSREEGRCGNGRGRGLLVGELMNDKASVVASSRHRLEGHEGSCGLRSQRSADFSLPTSSSRPSTLRHFRLDRLQVRFTRRLVGLELPPLDDLEVVVKDDDDVILGRDPHLRAPGPGRAAAPLRPASRLPRPGQWWCASA